MAKNEGFRRFGSVLVGEVPWGTHLCQFYENKEDLIDILVPYFAEGLRNNEFCMWVTSPPLEVEEAKAALSKVLPNLDEYFRKGQIEIISYDSWHLLGGKFDPNIVLQGWVQKEKDAIQRGFDGLRATGNMFWLERNLWGKFVDYEETVNVVIGEHKMIALCTYCLKNCSGTDVVDVVRNHVGTLIKQGQKWSLVEDITQRKKAEEKLEEYQKNLEKLVVERTKQLKDVERLAAIGTTAGMVGHDIRNPLQAITSDVYLAKTELASTPESDEKKNVLESLQEIESNIDYINKIVADLQDFARPLNPRAEEADLKLIIDDLLSKNGLPENVKASVKVETEAMKVVADSTFINRILFNLVNNAVQAMPKGGKLAIHAYKEANDVVITVKDTGVGIPEGVKSKLFTPMFTTKSKGQGFGLAVVKRMTEALGGTVTFESQEGKGTTFIVRLPPPKELNGKWAFKGT